MQQNKSNSGNVIIYVIVGVVLLFLFLKFVGPKIGIKIFENRGNSIEYAHAEGFPRTINVSADINKTRLVIRDKDSLKEAIAAIDKNNEIKIPMDLVVLDKVDLSIEFDVVKFVKECN